MHCLEKPEVMEGVLVEPGVLTLECESPFEVPLTVNLPAAIFVAPIRGFFGKRENPSNISV